MFSSPLHIDVCRISVLYILLCFHGLSILTSAVFQFCIFSFAFFVSAYWELQYLSSVYFTLLSSSLYIDICNISVPYTLLCFPRLCIFASAVFQFFIIYFTFVISGFWHLQTLSSLYFTLLSWSVDIDICRLWVLYILLCFLGLWILTSADFQFSIFYFAFLVSAYWYLRYFDSGNFSLLSLSLYIYICSISLVYI